MDLARYRLLTSDEAAYAIGFPVSTLRTWRSRRPGFGPPAVVVGGSVRYRWHDLDAWIRKHAEATVNRHSDGDEPDDDDAPTPQPSAAQSALPPELHTYRPLSSKEAALLIGFPLATLRTWRSRRPGFGPRALEIGPNVKYRLADLDAWITRHTEGPNGEDPEALAAGGPEEISQRGKAKKGRDEDRDSPEASR